MSAIQSLLDSLRDLLTLELDQFASKEPALIVGAVASVLVLAASKLGVVLDDASVQAVLTPLVVALFARFFVSPSASRPGAMGAGKKG